MSAITFTVLALTNSIALRLAAQAAADQCPVSATHAGIDMNGPDTDE